MKKFKLTIACFLLLSASILFVGCSSKTSDNTNSSTNSTTNSATTSSTDTTSTSDTAVSTTDTTTGSQTFTLDELKQYDGKNGNSAYVAVNGTVYDVTNAKNWNNGSHQGLNAGADLTSDLARSPHGESVLADLPVVGTLQ